MVLLSSQPTERALVRESVPGTGVMAPEETLTMKTEPCSWASPQPGRPATTMCAASGETTGGPKVAVLHGSLPVLCETCRAAPPPRVAQISAAPRESGWTQARFCVLGPPD